MSADRSAGQVTAGQVTAGQVTAGQVTAGQVTAGQATVKQATVTLAAALLTVSALLPSCRSDEDGSATTATSAPSASVASPTGSAIEAVPGRASFRTTSHEIAVGNLDARIGGMDRILKSAENAPVEQKLIGELLSRHQYLGTSKDLLRAVELAEEGIEGAPPSGDALVVRARVRSAVHRFDDALRDLEAADEAHATGPVSQIRASIWIGQGRYDDALPVLQDRREKHPNSVNLGLEAALLGRMGKTDEAHRRFDEALEKFRDVSPFTVAWIYNEWGAMYERVGDLAKAKQYYALALDRLPEYAHAAAHMAVLVTPTEGIRLLEQVLERSDDPEYRGQLGRLKNLVKPGSGDADIAEAKKGFGVLMEKLPLAYGDHAGWFWLGPGGDPKRAAAVALQNLEARKTPEAFTLALAATSATDDEAACKVARQARGLKYKTPSLERELSDASAECPDSGGAPAPGAAAPAKTLPAKKKE